MDYTFKLRRGTAAEWTAANPVLEEGEPGIELDTDKFKIGNGFHTWDQLPYYLSEDAITAYINQTLDNTPLGPEELAAVTNLVEQDLELPDLVLYYENVKA